jgi:hypothetical protein
MKSRIIISVITLLYVTTLYSYGQNTTNSNGNLTINVDTININIKGRIGASVKYDGKYYCFFGTKSPYGGSTKRLYILSENGNVEQIVDMPKIISERYYSDLFVKNDSIIVKDYYDKSSFYFDTKKSEWITINDVDDLVYEDDKFYVTYLDFGEWGGTMWFKDKKTNKEYEVASSVPIINKLNDIYYVTHGRNVIAIENPLSLKSCEPDYSYNIVANNIKNRTEFYGGSRSVAGTQIIFYDYPLLYLN